MKYYCECISVPLAEKLKEKGMPIEKEGENTWCPSFAECFDWLIEQKLVIVIDYTKYDWIATIVYNSLVQFKEVGEFFTWREAAESAIEKALELI